MSGVSVIIPVHNGAAHLAEAIDSALTQSLRPSAVVVVDDGSTDETPRVAASFNGHIRYARQERAGAAAARNRGVDLVENANLAFLDADDVWLPDKLARQMDMLESADRPAMVFGHAVQFASPELSADEVLQLKFDTAPMPAAVPSALLMRTRDFRAVGAFSAALKTAEFVEWYARARDAGIETRMLDQVVFLRRLHRDNHGRREREARGDYVRALKAVLDRRRE